MKANISSGFVKDKKKQTIYLNSSSFVKSKFMPDLIIGLVLL